MSTNNLINIYGGSILKGDNEIVIKYYIKRIIYNTKQLFGYMIYGSEFFRN